MAMVAIALNATTRAAIRVDVKKDAGVIMITTGAKISMLTKEDIEAMTEGQKQIFNEGVRFERNRIQEIADYYCDCDHDATCPPHRLMDMVVNPKRYGL